MFQFYEEIPENYIGNLYGVIERRKSTDPKVQDLIAIGYASASGQEEVTKGLAANLGPGFVAVLMDKNGPRRTV